MTIIEVIQNFFSDLIYILAYYFGTVGLDLF
jgi:hypothetical protein